MTFGDDLATMQQDVADTIQQGLPASKFVVGVDVSEHPQPPGGCGQFSHYAAQAGLAGAFVWEAHADYLRGNICADGLASGWTVTRRRHAVTALVLLGLLLGTGTGAAKVSHAPKNRSAPRVSGSPVVGRTLVASHGRWTRSPRGYSYRWLRCNAAGKRCRKISLRSRRATC